MTTTKRKTATKGWDVKPGMLTRLPEVMVGIAESAEYAARDRIAAAKMVLGMVQQEIARRKAEPTPSRPAVRIQLPENGRAVRRAGR